MIYLCKGEKPLLKLYLPALLTFSLLVLVSSMVFLSLQHQLGEVGLSILLSLALFHKVKVQAELLVKHSSV